MGTARLTPGLSFQEFVPGMPLSYHTGTFLLGFLGRSCVLPLQLKIKKISNRGLHFHPVRLTIDLLPRLLWSMGSVGSFREDSLGTSS